MPGRVPLQRPVRQHGTERELRGVARATPTRCERRYSARRPGLPARHHLLHADSHPFGGALGLDADSCTEQYQRFTSDWAARANRSRAFAAHGRAPRWRNAKASRCCLTTPITRSRKLSDEGAQLSAVGVDGLVIRLHIPGTSFCARLQCDRTTATLLSLTSHFLHIRRISLG